VRCRVAHNGGIPSDEHPIGWLPERFYKPEEAGGGAMFDLGAHPIYITNRLAGPAESISATFGSFYNHAVDDNAIITVKYKNGALGILEPSFVSGAHFFALKSTGRKACCLSRTTRI
jgi:scyllo-inositol 2-dehydrogenase (NAD+)